MRIKCGVILAVIGYIIFFFCIEGWGADWKFIAEDLQGTLWEIDTTSISRQPNNIVRAWVKKTLSKESVTGWVEKFGEKYKDVSHSMTLQEYHCTEKKCRILNVVLYSLGDGVVDSSDYLGEWSFIVLGSMGDVIFKELCK